MRSLDIILSLQLIKLDTSNLERKINDLDKKIQVRKLANSRT